MAMTKYKSVDEYIESFPPNVQAALRKIRTTVRKAVPSAEETISYSMPAFKHHGRRLVYYAGWKAHVSLYPASMTVMDEFADELAPYEVSKGTIKFPLDKPLPVALIRKVALFRAKENAERALAKNRSTPPSRRAKS